MEVMEWISGFECFDIDKEACNVCCSNMFMCQFMLQIQPFCRELLHLLKKFGILKFEINPGPLGIFFL